MPRTPSGSRTRARVVFSDLDGTLLRHEDYDWSEARGALAELRRRQVPLVIASSKTRAEIDLWRARIGNLDPFISENGGALYLPEAATAVPIPGSVPVAGYRCLRLGTPYGRIREALGALARELGVPLRGFGDMEAAEIASRSGLSGGELEAAREREHDEPFVPARTLTEEEEERLVAGAGRLGLRVTRGGRFHHLMGPVSKGAAARRLLEAMAAGGAGVRSLGLGDRMNDLELLAAMDQAVVVALPDGTHDPGLSAALPDARFTRGIGPAGFAEAVREFLAAPD